MKTFVKNTKLFKKIIIVMICILVISFCFPKGSQASGDTGGKLLGPIADLMIFLGDGIMDIIHLGLYNIWETTIHLDTAVDAGTIIFVILGAIVAVIAAVALIIITDRTCSGFFSRNRCK